MPDTAPKHDKQPDEFPDFVDRCLGLPEGERGPPDTELTLKWLVTEVSRLTEELAGLAALAHGQWRLFEQLEQIARAAIAQSKASRAELDALAVKAGNYDVIVRLLKSRQMRVVRARKGARPDLDRRTDWPVLLEYIDQHPSVAEAADVLATMQWHLENPTTVRVNKAVHKRLKGAWMTRISREKKLRAGSAGALGPRAKVIPVDLESEIERIVRKAARAT